MMVGRVAQRRESVNECDRVAERRQAKRLDDRITVAFPAGKCRERALNLGVREARDQ
jgi:hypothetical protein